MKSTKTFIGQSIKNFLHVGSVMPSSSRLAKKMIKGIKAPVIVELGPGTGVFTTEILNNLPHDGLLICVESNDMFVKYLHNKIKDKRLKIYHGNALHLSKFLQENGIEKVGCIISGLPIGHFKKDMKDKLFTEILKCLSDDGVFVQFEYFLAGIRAVKRAFPKIKIDFELLNFPPAFIMKCKK